VTPPAAAAAPTVHRARTVAPGRPFTIAPRPRRVSGPVRRELPVGPRRPAAQAEGSLALGLLEALHRVSRHRLLDRLIRGRTWIAIIAFALIGIVTLQLGLLKLNASIGRSLERGALLQRENAALSIENSELAAGYRVETSAARLGMEIVPTGALLFLTARPRVDAYRGAASLSTPVHTAGAPSSEAGAEASSTAGSPAAQPASGESSAAPASSASTAVQAPASTAAAPASAPAASTSTTGESATSTSTAVAAPSSATTGAPPAGGTAGGSREASPGGGTRSGPQSGPAG